MGRRGRSVETRDHRELPFPSAPRGISDEDWRLLLACGEAISAHIEGRRRPIWPPLSALVLAAAGQKPSDERPWQREPHADEASAAALVLKSPETMLKYKTLGKMPSVALAVLAIGAARYVYGGEVRPVGNLRTLFGLFKEHADRWHVLADELFTFASGKSGLLALSATDNALTALDGAVEVTPKALGALLGIPTPIMPEPVETPIERWARSAQRTRPSQPASTRPATQVDADEIQTGSAVDITNPTVRLSDVVLPADIRDELELAQRLCKRKTGAAAVLLMLGGPGLGESYAVQAFAGGLRRPLATLNIATVRSRYVGDTEKRVQQAFHEAEAAGAVLALEEADCLLTSRSGAHYQWEVAVVNNLLRLLEAPKIPVLLTTNAPVEALDDALLRRLTASLTFGLPDKAERERIWRLELKKARIREPLDIERLAQTPLSGGLIANAVKYLAAKRLLLGKKFAVTTESAISAIKREEPKMGTMARASRTMGFSSFLEPSSEVCGVGG